MVSNGRVLVAIVKYCFESKAWKSLQEHIVLLSKKHGLIKQVCDFYSIYLIIHLIHALIILISQAVTKMIQEAFTYVDKMPDKTVKLELIDTLRTVTEGKIYVEVERARLTRMLAKIKEDEGKINEAADILHELQVETYGSMEKREKTDFILEQMRLMLARKDYVRAQIISKKINTKYFENEEVQDLKLRYYQLMIQHALHEQQYLNICKYYMEVYQTPSVQADTLKWTEILRYVVMFIVLAPFNNEQSDLIHRIEKDKNLVKLPMYQQLLKSFITVELMRWPKVEELYRVELQKVSYVFDVKTEEGNKRWKDFHNRVIEHNIRTISTYYDRVTMRRLTELLDLTAKEAETFLSKLVDSKTIYAKMDRLDGIVVFNKRQSPDDVINEWAHDVNALLELISKTTHLITKEEMIHTIAQTTV